MIFYDLGANIGLFSQFVLSVGSTRQAAQTEQWIALLGRRDIPTDGIEDYCTFLGEALNHHSAALRNVRVQWAEKGWIGALRQLWSESAGWRGQWVLLQYTTMSWSRRGFPFGAYVALAMLRRRGIRRAVVFHEPVRQTGRRWIDRIRGACQDWVIRRLYAEASKAIFADPLETIAWLPRRDSKSVFIPIGANIPAPGTALQALQNRNGNSRTVAVFCLSDPPNRSRELSDISHATQFAAEQGLKVRIVFLGRGTPEAADEIERVFQARPVEVVTLGLRRAEEVSQTLTQADAMLCVRGGLCMRRGSALAGISCGLPIVGYAGEVAGTPITEAGVALVPYRDSEALGKVLARVLSDDAARSELRERSFATYHKYFSWDVIAAAMRESLERQEQPAE